MSNPEETITRSFRISEHSFRILREDAERQNISVNTLVNQILNLYVNFERYAKTTHMIKLPSQLLKSLLDAIQESMIIKIAQHLGENIAESIILVKSGTLSLESIITHLKDLSIYGYLFEYNEITTPQKITISLVHQFGLRGSLLFAHYIQSVFKRINIQPYFNITENAVTLEIMRERL